MKAHLGYLLLGAASLALSLLVTLHAFPVSTRPALALGVVHGFVSSKVLLGGRKKQRPLARVVRSLFATLPLLAAMAVSIDIGTVALLGSGSAMLAAMGVSPGLRARLARSQLR